MWKKRVTTCLQMAIKELLDEAERCTKSEATIRTELDCMVKQTRLTEIAARLSEYSREVEAVFEPKGKTK